METVSTWSTVATHAGHPPEDNSRAEGTHLRAPEFFDSWEGERDRATAGLGASITNHPSFTQGSDREDGQPRAAGHPQDGEWDPKAHSDQDWLDGM